MFISTSVTLLIKIMFWCVTMYSGPARGRIALKAVPQFCRPVSSFCWYSHTKTLPLHFWQNFAPFSFKEHIPSSIIGWVRAFSLAAILNSFNVTLWLGPFWWALVRFYYFWSATGCGILIYYYLTNHVTHNVTQFWQICNFSLLQGEYFQGRAQIKLYTHNSHGNSLL